MSANISPSKLNWPGSTIEVVSLGCGQLNPLSNAAISAIENAQVIIGAPHHFDEINPLGCDAEKRTFPSPFQELENLLLSNWNQHIVVLASGDALYFGVGSTLIKLVGRENCWFHPNISSVQACFHRIGLPWQLARVISLHGRPLSSLRRDLVNGRLFALLTDQHTNPDAMATELTEQGFGESTVWVCEAIGGDAERVQAYIARELMLVDINFHPLNVCIARLKGAPRLQPSFPGIADHLFSTGAEPGFGMISKREVRMVILSLMQPSDEETAWDIGAGCGSVSVEWARWNPSGKIFAIEPDVERIAHIETNCQRFGSTQNVKLVQGEAPEICTALPDPDCIFVGGSNGLVAMLDYAWSRLKRGGKLVASAVTESSQQALQQFYQERENREWIEMQVTKNLPNSGAERTLAPVFIAKCTKPF